LDEWVLQDFKPSLEKNRVIAAKQTEKEKIFSFFRSVIIEFGDKSH
jgi:hypothetical protein